MARKTSTVKSPRRRRSVKYHGTTHLKKTASLVGSPLSPLDTSTFKVSLDSPLLKSPKCSSPIKNRSIKRSLFKSPITKTLTSPFKSPQKKRACVSKLCFADEDVEKGPTCGYEVDGIEKHGKHIVVHVWSPEKAEIMATTESLKVSHDIDALDDKHANKVFQGRAKQGEQCLRIRKGIILKAVEHITPNIVCALEKLLASIDNTKHFVFVIFTNAKGQAIASSRKFIERCIKSYSESMDVDMKIMLKEKICNYFIIDNTPGNPERQLQAKYILHSIAHYERSSFAIDCTDKERKQVQAQTAHPTEGRWYTWYIEPSKIEKVIPIFDDETDQSYIECESPRPYRIIEIRQTIHVPERRTLPRDNDPSYIQDSRQCHTVEMRTTICMHVPVFSTLTHDNDRSYTEYKDPREWHTVEIGPTKEIPIHSTLLHGNERLYIECEGPRACHMVEIRPTVYVPHDNDPSYIKYKDQRQWHTVEIGPTMKIPVHSTLPHGNVPLYTECEDTHPCHTVEMRSTMYVPKHTALQYGDDKSYRKYEDPRQWHTVKTGPAMKIIVRSTLPHDNDPLYIECPCHIVEMRTTINVPEYPTAAHGNEPSYTEGPRPTQAVEMRTTINVPERPTVPHDNVSPYTEYEDPSPCVEMRPTINIPTLPPVYNLVHIEQENDGPCQTIESGTTTRTHRDRNLSPDNIVVKQPITVSGFYLGRCDLIRQAYNYIGNGHWAERLSNVYAYLNKEGYQSTNENVYPGHTQNSDSTKAVTVSDDAISNGNDSADEELASQVVNVETSNPRLLNDSTSKEFASEVVNVETSEYRILVDRAIKKLSPEVVNVETSESRLLIDEIAFVDPCSESQTFLDVEKHLEHLQNTFQFE